MATAFPGALDSFVNPTASSNMSDAPVLHHVQHANLNDAVRAMQVYMGITGSVSASDLTGKIATGGGGGGTAAAVRIAATTAIPLDTAGNGKAMPLIAGYTISITADITPTIAAGAVLNGVCVVDYLSTGTGNLILTNYNARGDTFAAEANRLFTVTYYKQTSGAFAVVQKGDLLVVVPVFSAQSAPAGTIGAAYIYTFVASSATSYGVFSGTVPAGLALNTATGALTGTPTAAATSAFVISATNAAGTTNSTAQSVVIGAAATAPGQVTALTLGTATSTTQPLTWTAPTSNGGSALTDYLIEYKLAAAPTYTTFAHLASTVTAIVVTGLTASNSYNYRVSAVNAIGTGVASAVGTGSTAAAGTGRVDNFTRANENPLNLPSDGGSAWFSTGANAAMKLDTNAATNNGAFNVSGSALLHTNAAMTVSATFVVGRSDGIFGVTARLVDGNNFACAFSYSNGQLTCQQKSTGTVSDLAVAVASPTVTNGTTHTLSIQISGTTAICILDGTTYFTVTASLNATALNGGVTASAPVDVAQRCTAFSIT